MRGGGLDILVRLERPGPLVREGRSRVASGWALVAERPAKRISGVGTERFANAENARTAPSVFELRLDPETEAADTTCRLVELRNREAVRTYDIKSVRPHPKDPRHWLEILAVESSVDGD